MFLAGEQLRLAACSPSTHSFISIQQTVTGSITLQRVMSLNRLATLHPAPSQPPIQKLFQQLFHA
jgi:hypothetical protein